VQSVRSTVDFERVVRMDMAQEEVTVIYDSLRVVSRDVLEVRTDPVEGAGALTVGEIINDRRMVTSKR
jgi:hypothetical protein